nr:MAG TPA: hypothetical protein [Caudoviricetes sp.]
MKNSMCDVMLFAKKECLVAQTFFFRRLRK